MDTDKVNRKLSESIRQACVENKRAALAEQEQPASPTQNNRPPLYYQFETKKLISAYGHANQHLDVHIDQEQQQELQHDIAVNMTVETMSEQQTETQLELDCEQDMPSMTVVFDTLESLQAEFSNSGMYGGRWAGKLWEAIFSSNRHYALSGTTRAAAQKLLQFHHIFEHNFNLDNRPDGFLIYKTPKGYVLGYNDGYERKKEKNPLTPVLEYSNSYKFDDESTERLIPGRTISFDQYFHENIHVGDKGFSALITIDPAHQDIYESLFPSETEWNYQSLRNAFLEQLADLLFKEGQQGVSSFLNFLSVIYAKNEQFDSSEMFLKAFVTTRWSSYKIDLTVFNKPAAKQALEKLKGLNETDYLNWLKLAYETHEVTDGQDNFATSVERFCYFLEEFKRITGGQELPQNFPHKKLTSPHLLECYLKILELAESRAEQLKVINDLPDFEAAYYAMRHEKFKFVSREMILSKSGGNTFVINDAELHEAIDKADNVLFITTCHRYFGLNPGRMRTSYQHFKVGLNALSDNVTNSVLYSYTMICSVCALKQKEDVDAAVSTLSSLTLEGAKKLTQVLNAWVFSVRELPSVAYLSLLVTWINDPTHEADLQELIQSGPGYLIGNPDKAKAFDELIAQIQRHQPSFVEPLLKRSIDVDRLLSSWDICYRSSFFENLKEQLHYFCLILIANPGITPQSMSHFINNVLKNEMFKRFQASTIEQIISFYPTLISQIADSSAAPHLFYIISHYIECRGLPANEENKKRFIESLCDYARNKPERLEGIKGILEQGITPAATRVMNSELEIKELMRDPHGHYDATFESISDEELSQVETVLKKLFADDPLKQDLFKSQYQMIHDLHHKASITINGCNKPVDELTDEEMKKALSALSEIVQTSEGLTKINYLLQYLATIRVVMYRTTGLMPNCTQLLSCLFLLNNEHSLIMGIESNEGKSLMSALYACLNRLSGKTVSVVSASAMLSHRDFSQFENFYRYMGIPVKYLKANSSLDEYQEGAVHYAGYSHYLLFIGRKWYEEGYIPHKQALIADEVQQMLLLDYMHHHRNVMPLEGQDGLKMHPAPELFYLADAILRDVNNHNMTVNEFANLLYKKAGARLKAYLEMNYKDLSQWELLVADTLSALLLKEREHFLITVDQQEGCDFARPLMEDTVSKHGKYTIQNFLHARLNVENPDKKFPIEQEQCFSSLSSSNLWEHFAMQEGNIAIGLTATPGSKEQREELLARYPGTEIFEFPTHRQSKRTDHDKKPREYVDRKHQEALIMEMINARPNQPIVVVCKTIAEVERLAKTIHEACKDRPLQYSHSAGGCRWEADGNEHIGKVKKQALIEQLGQAGQITIVTPKYKAGTNFRSAHDAVPILEIITYCPSELDYEQMIRRVARDDQTGETAWIPLEQVDLEKLRKQQYQHEQQERELQANVSQILFKKLRIFAECLGELYASKTQLKSRPDSEELKKVNAQIQEKKDAWVTFSKRCNNEWRLQRIRQTVNLGEFSKYVDEEFKLVESADKNITFIEVKHPKILPDALEYSLMRGVPQSNEHVRFCTWYHPGDYGYQGAYEKAREVLLEPFWGELSQTDDIDSRFKAKELTSASFPLQDRLLTKVNLNKFCWVNKKSPRLNDGKVITQLKTEIGRLLAVYHSQAGVARYRVEEATLFSSQLEKASSFEDLLKAVNDSSKRAFEEDEKFNQKGYHFFKRNFLFSRYQLLLQDARSLILTAAPAGSFAWSQNVFRQELNQISAFASYFGVNRSDGRIQLFLQEVGAWIGANLSGHYMKQILKTRCEFLSNLLNIHPDSAVNKLGREDFVCDVMREDINTI